jgi:IS30 family transposase
MLSAIAELERDLLVERTNAGIARAKAEGKHVGRPFALSDKQRAQVQQALAAGVPIAQIARDQDTSRQTIMRVRDDAGNQPFGTVPKAKATPTTRQAKKQVADDESDHAVRAELDKRGQRRLVA